jgi:hypothetical protein
MLVFATGKEDSVAMIKMNIFLPEKYLERTVKKPAKAGRELL